MIKCGICEQSILSDVYGALKQCKHCKHVFAPLSLSLSEAEELYGKDYFHGEEYVDYVSERESLIKNFRLRNKELKPFIEFSSSDLLDVGCAYGFYVEESNKHFNKAIGIDIAAEAVNYGRKELKQNLINGDLLSHDFGAQKFDLITMWDTIEHLNEPKKYLQKIHELLNPSGVVVFTTGDISSLVPKIRGKKWRMIHPPTHLHYFSPDSAKHLLESTGFKICKIKHSGVYRSLGNIAYNLFVLRNNFPFIYQSLKFLNMSEVCIYINTFDIMTVIARKE